MKIIKETFLVAFCFLFVGLFISRALEQTVSPEFSDLNTTLICLLLDFIIVKFTTVFIFDNFKPTSVLLGALIGFIVSFILVFYQNYIEFHDSYILSELIGKTVFNELIVILMLFNFVYILFGFFTLNGLSRKVAEAVFVPLIAIIFLFSSTSYMQHLETLQTGNAYIRDFDETIETTIAKMETGTYREIENEIDLLESDFYQLIGNFYDLGYKEKSLFDEIDDYITANQTKTDIDKVRNFLVHFLQDYRELRERNSFITDKKINAFLSTQMEKFEANILKETKQH